MPRRVTPLTGAQLVAQQLVGVAAAARGLGQEAVGRIDPSDVLIGVPPVTVTRPSDLLRLRFDFVNLSLVDTEDGLVLERGRTNAPAYLVVDHQPQHLMERAGRETQEATTYPSRPTEAILSTHSRVVFSVGSVRVPWTIDGLLAACTTLPLALAPNAEIDPPTAPLPLHPEIPWPEIPWPEAVGAVLTRGWAQVQVGAANAPGLVASLGAVKRSLRAARVLDGRIGSVEAISAVTGLQVVQGLGQELGRLGLEEGPSVAELLAHPEPAAPGATETSLELPWRLKLSPGPTGAFVHSTAPVEHGGRTELWHSRLGRRVGSGESGYVVENDAHVRAIWARDFPGGSASVSVDPQAPSVLTGQDGGWDAWSLLPSHRTMLVHESSNFGIKPAGKDYFVPPVVKVDPLVLSSQGGWLGASFELRRFPVLGLNLVEWREVMTQGREHYVKTVLLGSLFPFGHKAALVTITERKFRPDEIGNPAYLLKREYVVVIERTRSYASSFEYGDKRDYLDPGQPRARRKLDLVMPFSSVTILTHRTPLLDPHTDAAGGALGAPTDGNFFPTVARQPFGFRILAVDRLGNTVEYPGPLLFVNQPSNAVGALDALIKAYYALGDGDQTSHRLGGQRVGYAPDTYAGKPMDTVLATHSLRWDAMPMPTPDPPNEAQYAPMLRAGQVAVPSISVLAGRSEPITVRYPPTYSQKGFDDFAQVFLHVDGKPQLSFSQQQDRSGGFAAPNLAISGLSGSSGPLGGDPERAATGTATPADFFSGLADAAKLFGIVPISELLPAMTPDAFPRFAADAVDRVTALEQDLGRLVALGSQLPARIGTLAEAGTAQAQAVVDAAEAVAASAAVALGDLAPYVPGGPFAGHADVLKADLATVAAALDQASFLPVALRADASGVVRRLMDQVETVAELTGLLDQVAGGLALPETVRARLHWSTTLKPWGPTAGTTVFQPRPAQGESPAAARSTLDLDVQVQAPVKQGGTPTAVASCSLSPFTLQLLGADPFIALDFERISFSLEAGKKADVDVVFAGQIRFGGPLEFVNVLRTFIPDDGFSDPPYLDVTPAGIKAGYDLALPDIPIGIVNLTQVSLGAQISVPFLGESLDFRFSFCTRERPFHLTVWVFGGGGFFAVTVTPKECRILEAAFEFGAAASIDFGVASGSVEVMAGIYFRLEKGNSQLTGYFRLRGEVDVLGLISASLELYLELSYEIDTNVARGRAQLTIEVEVLMFSTSVTIECEKKFQGSDKDPTFVQMLGPAGGEPLETSPWADYCAAFART